MKKNLFAIPMAAALLTFSSCSDDNNNTSSVDTSLNAQVLADFSANLALPVYTDLSASTATLYSNVLALETGGATDDELAAARTSWKAARAAYEQSEAFLFGPVSTDAIDPRIDTWPVNFTDLDAQLASNNAFTSAYIDNLEDALKGFHPIEYLLFGENGTKKAADLSARDIEYLKGLSLNLKDLTADLSASWDASVNDSYYHTFQTAGSGSAVYSTQLAAFEELVNSMSGICEEVANGKLAEPYTQKDPSLEESPFSSNSIVDFTNNIKGVQDVYLGKYSQDGKGLEDLVKKYNLQLDATVKEKISAAINALGAITVPFGRAITEQPVQIQNAMDAINDLKDTIDGDLMTFVQLHVK